MFRRVHVLVTHLKGCSDSTFTKITLFSANVSSVRNQTGIFEQVVQPRVSPGFKIDNLREYRPSQQTQSWPHRSKRLFSQPLDHWEHRQP